MVETMVPKEELLEQRLDGLEKKVDEGFERIDEKMDAGFARLDSDVRELRDDMNTLKYGLLAATVLILVALIGCCATLVAVL
jgi:predicted nuclease with TOPRIM domain